MAGYEALHLAAPLGVALARLGLSAEHPHQREVIPAAARGTNLVVTTPPAAVHALPGLAGALSRLSSLEPPALLLILTHPAVLAEWTRVTSRLAVAAGLPVLTASGGTRAARMLKEGQVRVLLTTPEIALGLVQRSALKLDQVATVLLAWPEQWEDESDLAALMQDLPESAARIIYTTDPRRAEQLGERYARRGHSAAIPFPALPQSSMQAVRLAVTAWSRREETVRGILDVLDPSRARFWALVTDPELGPPALPGMEPPGSGPEPGGVTIAWDLPDRSTLDDLMSQGTVVLLVPPEAVAWAARVLPGARPVRTGGAVDRARTAAARRHQAIESRLETADLEGALLALAPLLERYDPAHVAAALYQLWTERTTTPPDVEPAPDVLQAATTRLWVGVGRKDGATPADFVGLLTREAGLERSKVGKVEIRELYSLVEVPAVEAESLIRVLNGQTIRRRRVTARVDQPKRVAGRK